ncbi:MAG: GDP-mannose 4,6-dehydratase [Planctomycetes bacterium]|nr:GDP-mannose 4,6-dehydratase [Planctomycetota bacterium]
MRHLITGGAGFIGGYLAESLLERGHEVHVLDNLSTGSMDNIQRLRRHPGFTYTIDTIFHEPLLAELIDQADQVHHLAAAVGVQLIIKSPVRTIETNTQGTELVLEHAAKKSKRVFFASTSEVYGKSQDFPFSEEGDLVLGAPSKGRWSYACSKALDEFLCLAYWHEKSLPTTILRLFNTVGARQVGHYGMVLPTFVRQALRSEPITVFGNGCQSRCFSAVQDVVDCWIALSENAETVGQIYNIGSSHEITILGLARLVKEVTGSSSEIVQIPYDTAYEQGFEDMPRRVPDTRRLRQTIGMVPETPIARIVESVVAHERERLDSSAAKPQAPLTQRRRKLRTVPVAPPTSTSAPDPVR